MRIAFFNYLPLSFGGGLARAYHELAYGLHKKYPSIKPQIVSLDESSARLIQDIYSAFYVRDERIKPGKKSNDLMAHTIPELGRMLSRFDLIYSKNDILELTLLMLARFGAKLPPVIIGFHTPVHYAKTPTIQAKVHNFLYASLYYRSLLKQAAGFHVLNSYHEDKLKQMMPGKPVAKIHNPVDTSLYKTGAGVRTKDAALKALWVGRLTQDKGCDDLIRLVDGGRRRTMWTIVGDGAMRTKIAKLIKRCNNIRYFPRMNSTDLAREYRRHDVFVSTSQWECLPYTVLEAQFSGMPVIAYDIPGVSDIIVHKKTGILATHTNEIARSLEQFNPSRFNKKIIRSVVLKRFNPQHSVTRFRGLLQTTYDKSLR